MQEGDDEARNCRSTVPWPQPPTRVICEEPPTPTPKVEFRPTNMQNYDGWYVQVVMPGVPPIAPGGFKTEKEAVDWVRWTSKMWLDEHREQYF
jgi:hypothetical protein